MKRVVYVMIVAMLFGMGGSFLFADITVGARLDTGFMPFQYVMPEGKDAYSSFGMARVDGSEARLQLSITATNADKNVGVQAEVRALFGTDAGGATPTLALGDHAYVWYKPIDWLNISAGKFIINDLQGKIGHDDWRNFTVMSGDEKSIMHNFDTNGDIYGNTGRLHPDNSLSPRSGVGLALTLKPIDGLTILAGMRNVWVLDREGSSESQGADIGYMRRMKKSGKAPNPLQYMQFGVGYNIANIGFARAQFLGATQTPNDQPALIRANEIELAFAFTMIENLTLDLGFGLPLRLTAKDGVTADTEAIKGISYQKPYELSLGASYKIGAFTLPLRVDMTFAGAKKVENDASLSRIEGFGMRFYMFPSYTLNNIIAFTLSGGVNFMGDTEDGNGNAKLYGGIVYGFGAYTTITFASKCSIRAGLAYSAGDKILRANKNGTAVDSVFSIPILFTASL